MNHPARTLSKREKVFLAGLVIVLGATLLFFTGEARAPHISSETRFLERTQNGMHIMPASCPSDPHSLGDCTPWISFVTEGASTGHLKAKPNIVAKGAVTHLFWHALNAASCTVKGTNGDSWSTLSSDSMTSSNASPSAGVSGGSKAPGAPFAGPSKPVPALIGVASSPIKNQTVFTLTCQALPYASSPADSGLSSGATSITESVIVNLVPVFQEK